jgi:hypothetical protein
MSETKKINVRVWSGSGSAFVVEMANAGKRGKTCRALRISTSAVYDRDPAYGEVRHFLSNLEGLDGTQDFDDVVTMARAVKAEAPSFEFYLESVRGIDAPKAKLLARNEKFSASADESGVHLADLTDHCNEPRALSRGSASRAYDLAKKVWSRVELAETFHQAVEILESAGIDLHCYCGMD